MYLEPDDRYGSDLLKAIRSVLVNID
jgi:hypothetical protein